MANNLNIPKAIYLYNEGLKGLNFKGLESFVKKNFGKVAVKIIKLKERIIETKGLVFDPIKTRDAFEKIAIPHHPTPLGCKSRPRVVKNACHIILTDKLFVSFDEDKRLHIRASIYGFPSIISISGIVEGPAKPKEYYLYKDRFIKIGAWAIEEPKVKKIFKGRFIDYGDKRINEVLKGYLSQAVFFHITGEPFCPKKGCRLFNSHWQEELIYSQLTIGRFCPAHIKLLKSIRK